MREEIRCESCREDIRKWNAGYGSINNCPSCGAGLCEQTVDKLYRQTQPDEIADVIRERILETMEGRDDLDAGDLPFMVWEGENVNGALFCSNYEANLFMLRHRKWVLEAANGLSEMFSKNNHYCKMLVEDPDKLLPAAFIQAAQHYLFDQLKLDWQGILTEDRKEELRELMKETKYDGEF